MKHSLEISWKVLKHPVAGVVAGVVIATIFYWVSRAKVEPKYSVGKAELLAEKGPDAPKMSVLWDGKEVKNVLSAEVVIWNGGRKCLDKSQISKTNPVRIVPSEEIDILSARAVESSREDLLFRTQIKEADGREYVLLEVEGDEALERDDGCLIKLLYTGNAKCDFRVTGRVKGCRMGFSRVPWSKIKGGRVGKIFSGIAGVYMILSIFPILVGIRRFRKGKTRLGVAYVVQGLVILGVAVFFFLTSSQQFFAPAWMK